MDRCPRGHCLPDDPANLFRGNPRRRRQIKTVYEFLGLMKSIAHVFVRQENDKERRNRPLYGRPEEKGAHNEPEKHPRLHPPLKEAAGMSRMKRRDQFNEVAMVERSNGVREDYEVMANGDANDVFVDTKQERGVERRRSARAAAASASISYPPSPVPWPQQHLSFEHRVRARRGCLDFGRHDMVRSGCADEGGPIAGLFPPWAVCWNRYKGHVFESGGELDGAVWERAGIGTWCFGNFVSWRSGAG